RISSEKSAERSWHAISSSKQMGNVWRSALAVKLTLQCRSIGWKRTPACMHKERRAMLPLFVLGGATRPEQLQENEQAAHQQRGHIEGHNHPIHAQRIGEYAVAYRLNNRVHRVQHAHTDAQPDQGNCTREAGT